MVVEIGTHATLVRGYNERIVIHQKAIERLRKELAADIRLVQEECTEHTYEATGTVFKLPDSCIRCGKFRGSNDAKTSNEKENDTDCFEQRSSR